MADVAWLNPSSKGAQVKLRSLLEDVVEYHTGVYPNNRLALAVWFGHVEQDTEKLLELFRGVPKNSIATSRFSLLWKSGSESPPFVELQATSVEHFSEILNSNGPELAAYFDNPRVLYFDKALLVDNIRAFNIVTEPTGLIKGWYVDPEQYKKLTPTRNLISSFSRVKPQFGLVKTNESPDFENCRGLLQVEVNQRWLPLSLNGLRDRTYFNDLQDGRPGYFLFQGGALYQLLKFEEKTEPEYSNLVLERLPDDRYPEVYLRAVHSTAEPAA